MDKINILWIEDNPLQEAVNVKNLVERDSSLKDVFSSDLYDYPIPAIHFDEPLEGYEKYFNLQVLQHPIEIKDFITMCLQIEDNIGVAAFLEMDGVLPEIITFDYHFGAKITVNQGSGAMSYNPKTAAIRKFINPNHKLLGNKNFGKLFDDKEFLLEKSESENYSQNDFLKEISKARSFAEIKDKDRGDLIEDDIGLISAMEILRIFREHTIVAIPATFVKHQIENLSLHGKFFEWLNEYEYGVSFQREERGSKKWDSILKDAALTLRRKIENHLQLGKITIQYTHLDDLYNGKLQTERVFTFESIYGVRRLALDGLFIDKPEAIRSDEIVAWAATLIKIYTKKSGFSFQEYEEAKQGSENLLNAYKTNLVENRIELSILIVRYLNGEISINEKRLEKLMKLFKVEAKQIQDYKDGGSARSVKISDNIHEFRLENDKVYKKATKRLIALMTDIRLHKIFQEFSEDNSTVDVDNRIIKLLKQRPTYDDLLLALFPVPESPLILPYHLVFLNNVFAPNEMKKRLKQPYQAWETALDNLKLREGGQQFPANLSIAEKQVCLSLASELKLKRENFPLWLLK